MSSAPFDAVDWLALTLGIALTLAVNGCGDAGAGNQYGELVECDRVNESPDGSIRTVRAAIPTEPGETLTITECFSYWIVDEVEQEPPVGDPEGCVSQGVVAEGEEYLTLCSDYVDDGTSVTEYGFEEVYFRRVEEEIR